MEYNNPIRGENEGITLKVKFWGVRGSAPSATPETAGVGGNTSCVQLLTDQPYVLILDAGTGIRLLGNTLVAARQHEGQEIYLLLSHTHWDHIQGLPFFKLANYASNRLHIYGANKPYRTLEEVLRGQMDYAYFPVALDEMGAQFCFHPVAEETFVLPGGIEVTTRFFEHPGGVLGYRIAYQGKVLVYATDMEYTVANLDPRLVEFAQGADLLVFDAQYTHEELNFKTGWGHSTYLTAVHLAQAAGVKQLRLFSHDPDRTDAELEALERQAQQYFPATWLAREQQVIDLNSL